MGNSSTGPIPIGPKSGIGPDFSSGIVSTATLGVQKGTRRVLIDSGANILLAPNDNNMTNVTRKTYHVTGVHGTSSLNFVGRLPTLVTNMGDKLHFDVDCPINLTTTGLREDRTIVAPTLLNDMGITVLLQDNTTVLLRTSTVKISGEIVHQEKFSEGLSYIHVEDNGTPRRGAGAVQIVDTTRPYLRTQHVRGNLKGQMTMAAKANFHNLRKAAPAHRLAMKPPVWGVAYTASRSKFKLGANSWERWHAKLGHLSFTSLRIAAEDKVDLTGVTSANCECPDCLTTKVQSHPHEHGHAHLGGHDHKPGESMHMDNSGMFAWSIGNKRYRFLAVDYNTGSWFNHHAAKKTEAPIFFARAKSEFKATSGNSLRFIRTDSDSIFNSKEMKEIYIRSDVKATFSAPNDHAQNSIAENGIKQLNRDVRTAMKSSGAPAYLWPEADNYCVHMHNHLPTQKGKIGPESRYTRMRGGGFVHNMSLFMPFGCKAHVMIPEAARTGHKLHTQKVGWTGVFVGYGETTGHGGAYRIFNPETRKVETVSYNFVTCVEDSFPFRSVIEEDVPLSFEPTIETFADEAEWNRYRFSPEEEKEVLSDLSIGDPEKWRRSFHALSPATTTHELSTPPVVSELSPYLHEPQYDQGRDPPAPPKNTVEEQIFPLEDFSPQPLKKSWK